MPTYKNPGKIEFEGIIQDAGGGGCYVDFPYSVEELFGVKGRVPVMATFDGIPYRGSLVKMGGACHIVPILKAIREKLGKSPGDTVRVTVELDTEERIIEVPSDVRAAMDHDDVSGVFDKLAFTHRREYIQWINQAKTDETRQRRIIKMLEQLQAKR